MLVRIAVPGRQQLGRDLCRDDFTHHDRGLSRKRLPPINEATADRWNLRVYMAGPLNDFFPDLDRGAEVAQRCTELI
jgi:hypothetical protein